jgi:hypothetical protein
MSVVGFGSGNLRQTDLTTFDCSLRRLAIHPLMLAASCLLPFLSRTSASQKITAPHTRQV